jgi:prepilin-type N-terminal cleavage/methylation domain-containing protein
MRRRAFTLFELLITLGIVAMLSGAIMAFFWSLLDRRAAITLAAARQQGAGALIERIECDLSCGIAGDQQAGAGIRGNGASLTLLSRGVWMPEAGRRSALGDLQGAEYSFDRSAGIARCRRWIAGEQDSAEPETICENVALLRFRYYDGSRWSAAFDSLERGELPVAIEVALWFGVPGEESAQPAQQGGESEKERPALPIRDPDRVRLVIVPDGPVDEWKELR